MGMQAQIKGQDSTFHLKRFDQSDIKAFQPTNDKKITAANRITENSTDLPVRTYVITAEEIRANGYTTLVDILKTLPGFRTSQPGSAELGETFLMRGLLGNTHAKIMVNSVPVNPSAAPGMPLGAQLPIKQAERVEIILGPASSLYGNDAMAGVINIVLPEVNRPVQAMGNVALGTNGLTEIHLSLGGMLGRRKNVVRYSFFGSTQRMKNLNFYIPVGDNLFALDIEELTDSMSNFRVPVINDSFPDIENLTHESRVIGASANFRGFKVGFMGMFRKDHSALGSHPENISYHDPNTFTAEYIYNSYIQYKNEKVFRREKEKKGTDSTSAETQVREHKLSTFTNLTGNFYRMDENSSFEGLLHPVVTDRNFIYAESDDFLLEQLFNYNFDKKLNIMVGGSMRYTDGIPYISYLDRPFEEEDVITDGQGQAGYASSSFRYYEVDSTAPPQSFETILSPWLPKQHYFYTDLAVFSQVYYRSKYVNVIAGFRLDRPDQDSAWVGSPKLGITVKPNDKWRIRASYSQAFRRPSPYYDYNYYYQPPPPTGSPEGFNPFIRVKTDLAPEVMYNFEGGVTWMPNEKLTLEGHFFRHVITNSLFPQISYRILGETDDSTRLDVIGYANLESISVLNSFQGFATYTGKNIRLLAGGQINYGFEQFAEVDTLESGYRSVPSWMLKANITVKIPKIADITIHNQLLGKYVGGLTEENNQISRDTVAGYYNTDLIVTKRFANKLQAYLKINNLTNSPLFTSKRYDPDEFSNVKKGLYTTPLTGNDLEYIPQMKTVYLLGLTYTLN